MGLKTEERTIDGVDFTTQQLPARKAFSLFTRLSKMLAPVLSGLEGDIGRTKLTNAKGEVELDLKTLAPALTGLLAGFGDEAATEKLVQDILSHTTAVVEHEGKRQVVTLNRGDTIDLAFAGRLPLMFRALMFALEVNYQDFFDAARNAIRDLAVKSKSAETPTTDPSP